MASHSDNNVDLRMLEKFRAPTNLKNFTLNGYHWSEQWSMSPPVSAVQKIILEEFQVQPMFDYWKAIGNIMKISSTGGSAKDAEKAAKDAATGLTGFGAIAGQVLTYALEEGLFNYYLKNPESAAMGLPIQMITDLFAGNWLNRYEVPYFDSTYLEAKGGDWGTGGLNKGVADAIEFGKGEDKTKFSSCLNNTNLDIPIMPSWNQNTEKRSIQTEFYLLNTDLDKLKINYTFLNAFIAGALWLQMDIVKRPPNIYRVTVPGRFTMLWASMDIECKMVGKLRRNPTFASSQGLDVLTLFPDSYKISLRLTDLLPSLNNYNTYAYYQKLSTGGIVNVKSTSYGTQNDRNTTGAGALATSTSNAIKGGVQDETTRAILGSN